MKSWVNPSVEEVIFADTQYGGMPSDKLDTTTWDVEGKSPAQLTGFAKS